MTLAELFVLVCRMSVIAMLVALPVMLLSLVFDWLKVPKKFSCLLFAPILFRMLCPLALPGQISIFNVPVLQETQQNIMARFDAPAGDYEGHVAGTEEYDRAVAAGVAPEEFYGHEDGIVYYKVVHGEIKPADRAMDTWVPVLTRIWLIGMAVFYGFTLLSYLLLKRKLRFAVKLEGNVYVSDRIPSPCVVGYIHPRIYLVPGLSETEQAHILAHERAHLRAGDHWAKLIAWLALGVHWFNYWLWGVHDVYCAQIEGACDERVIREADDETREAYSQTLLNLAYNRRFRWLNPVSFSEGGTKERVKNVLRYKKPNAALIVLAVTASAVLLVSCGTDGGLRREGGISQSQTDTNGVIIDHTGVLTQVQMDALTKIVAGGQWGISDGSEEWLNCQGFTVFEIVHIDVQRDESSALTEMQGKLLDTEGLGTYVIQGWQGMGIGTWIPDIVPQESGGETGIAFCMGMCDRYVYELTWNGSAFLLEEVLTEYDASETTLFSDAAERSARRMGVSEDSVKERLCERVGAWYGCRAYDLEKNYDGKHYTFVCNNGSVTVTEYENTAAAQGQTVYTFDYGALRDAGKKNMDISDWTNRQLVRALPASEGKFYTKLGLILTWNFCGDDTEDILREITALGADDRSAACWMLADHLYEMGRADVLHHVTEKVDGLISDEAQESRPPAKQDTAQMIWDDYNTLVEEAAENTGEVDLQKIAGIDGIVLAKASE